MCARVGGEIFRQSYRKGNTICDNTRRNDQTCTVMAGLYWDVNRHLTIIAPQDVKTRVFSNIFMYDDDRDVYSAGFELRP